MGFGGGGGGGGGVFVSFISPIMLNLTQLRQCGDCHEHETESRVRRFHEYGGSPTSGSARRNPAARERIPQASRAESAKAWAEAEDQAFRFPRPWRRLEWRRRAVLAGQVAVGQSLARDLRNHCAESLRIIHVLPVVVTESLFVDVPEQVEWLHADIGTMETALQEAPEVFDCICVYITAHLFDRMVDYCVIVIVGQSIIRKQFIAENRGTGFDVFADRFLKFLPSALINVHRADFPIALDHTKDDCFVGPASAVNLFSALALVHVARLAGVIVKCCGSAGHDQAASLGSVSVG